MKEVREVKAEAHSWRYRINCGDPRLSREQPKQKEKEKESKL